MATTITTIKNADKTDNLLPRTQIKAIFDKNGNYLDNDLTADDINVLKGGNVSGIVTHSDDGFSSPLPLNADKLENHPASYFATADELSSLSLPSALTMEGVTYTSAVTDITGGYCVVNKIMFIKIRCIINSTSQANYFSFPVTSPTAIACPVLFMNWSQDSAPLHAGFKANGDLQLKPNTSGSVYNILACFPLL